jgi:hypothetical protein
MAKKAFSIFRGYTFSFEDEGNKIEAWFSGLSGMEKVYVNKKLISSKRSYSRNSSNTFLISENNYSISMKVISLLKGPFICTLTKNGQILRRQKIVFPQPAKKNLPFFTKLWFWLIAGATFGVIKAFLNFPDWTLFVFAGASFLFIFIYFIKFYNGHQPFIEEENDITE